MKRSGYEHGENKPLGDAESARQIVESLADRRSGEEKRIYPRFMTPEALKGKAALCDPIGMLVCRVPPPLVSLPNTPLPPALEAANREAAQGVVFENVSRLSVIDFSEEGVQIFFQYDNPARIASHQFFFQIGTHRIPVVFKWYQPFDGGNAGGFSFLHPVDSSPHLAGFLVRLSDRLLDFLIHDYLAAPVADYREASMFTYLSIFYNLRLRFLEAVASFNDAKACVEEFVEPDRLPQMMHILLEFECLRSLHFKQARALGRSKPLQATLERFMKPCREFGCGIESRSQKLYLLETDILNTLLNSLVFWNWGVQPPREVIEQVKPLYETFTVLRTLLPGVFDGEAFDRQFSYYSFLLRSVTLLKDRLIDLISAPQPFRDDLGVEESPRVSLTEESSRSPLLPSSEPFGPSPLSISRLLQKAEFEESGTEALERTLMEAYGRDLGIEPTLAENKSEAVQGSGGAGGSVPLPDGEAGKRRFGRAAGVLSLLLLGCLALGFFLHSTLRPVLQCAFPRLEIASAQRAPSAHAPALESPAVPGAASPGSDQAAPASRLPSNLPAESMTAKAGTAKDPGNAPQNPAAPDTPPAATSAAASPESAQASGKAPRPDSAASARAGQLHSFGLEALQECWIRVSVDGKTVSTTTLAPGNTVEWKVKDRIQIVLGNSGGVRAHWDGQPLGKLGRPGQVVRLSLPDARLSQAAVKNR